MTKLVRDKKIESKYNQELWRDQKQSTKNEIIENMRLELWLLV